MFDKLTKLPINDISPNPYQPRRHFDEEKLNELSQSIQENGLIQPIVVRKSEILGYELIAGERRWRASLLAGLTDIPVIIKQLSDQDSMKQAIIENLQRANLNPIEEAKAYQQLVKKMHMTHDDIAKTMGKSRPYITNMIRLLNLPDNIKEAVESQQLTQGHARLLLNLKADEQKDWFEQCLQKKLSVRQLESHLKTPKKQYHHRPKDIFSNEQAKEMSQLLGLPVQITKTKSGQGQVKISFETIDDFDRIINKLK